MFATILLILLIFDSLVLIAAILLQSGKGAGMAASFGGVSSSPDAFIGTRQAGNLLTKVTWWAGGIFIAIAFILQVASVHTKAPRSVLEQGLNPAPTAPAPSAPLPNTTAPALPFQSAPTTPTTPPASGAPAPGGAARTPAPAGPTGAAPKPAPK